MKRIYKIEIVRTPNSRYMRPKTYQYTVTAGRAEDAIAKCRAQAQKDTGYSAPWRIQSLQDLGETI